ncbi:uncharacterized protein PITG_11446 [Phytophthora infestans T30-4]|uniref:Uncharacterized protein n=1 Tax=Phytophthora infestans (strain T30-4) TaxID=403677 RepID=D0NIS9_PHYIT|nr:uncharacterized protein PITG_11446 [Phytophthora infestans T30-4]EEY59413.1 conserved hypothetical protein [Phytophthora infestans T30-4]|eukprot:XP_002901023.1 conserved hypothetical protein [Phytophthora infestans T30-4]
MSGKSDISFLLNPQPTVEEWSMHLTPPMSPSPSATVARLTAMAQSPAASAMSSSLLLLGSCIAPREKMSSSYHCVNTTTQEDSDSTHSSPQEPHATLPGRGVHEHCRVSRLLRPSWRRLSVPSDGMPQPRQAVQEVFPARWLQDVRDRGMYAQSEAVRPLLVARRRSNLRGS